MKIINVLNSILKWIVLAVWACVMLFLIFQIAIGCFDMYHSVKNVTIFNENGWCNDEYNISVSFEHPNETTGEYSMVGTFGDNNVYYVYDCKNTMLTVCNRDLYGEQLICADCNLKGDTLVLRLADDYSYNGKNMPKRIVLKARGEGND